MDTSDVAQDTSRSTAAAVAQAEECSAPPIAPGAGVVVEWIGHDSYHAAAESADAVVVGTVIEDLGVGGNTGGLPPVDQESGVVQPSIPMHFVRVEVDESRPAIPSPLIFGVTLTGGDDDAALALCPGQMMGALAARNTLEQAPGVTLADGSPVEEWWGPVAGPATLFTVNGLEVVPRAPLPGAEDPVSTVDELLALPTKQ
jgi:hypothetical protein